VKRPIISRKRLLYTNAYIAAPTAVKKAAIEIKKGHGLTETR
jgi:hypothetical protein